MSVMQHQGPTELPGEGCKVSCNPPSQSKHVTKLCTTFLELNNSYSIIYTN